MVIGRNNGVVGLTGFSDKKMSGLLFGPQKSGRNNGVVVWRGSSVVTTFNVITNISKCKNIVVLMPYLCIL